MPWKIHTKKSARWGKKYYLHASATENGHAYELIASWDAPIYAINLYKDGNYQIDHALLNLVLWNDTDMEKLTPRILRATQRNIETLKKDGHTLIGPEEGDMACGEYGMGRMSEPEDIFKALEKHLS